MKIIDPKDKEELEKLEDELLEEGKEKIPMPVEGRSVFEIQKQKRKMTHTENIHGKGTEK